MDQVPHEPQGQLAGRHVLVVEDEMLLALELFDELEAAGATPAGPARSVQEALHMLDESSAWDAVLINVHLQGEASFPVARRLLELRIPFLFLTGNDDFVREHFPEVPREPKPWDAPKLVAALDKLMARARVSKVGNGPK